MKNVILLFHIVLAATLTAQAETKGNGQVGSVEVGNVVWLDNGVDYFKVTIIGETDNEVLVSANDQHTIPSPREGNVLPGYGRRGDIYRMSRGDAKESLYFTPKAGGAPRTMLYDAGASFVEVAVVAENDREFLLKALEDYRVPSPDRPGWSSLRQRGSAITARKNSSDLFLRTKPETKLLTIYGAIVKTEVAAENEREYILRALQGYSVPSDNPGFISGREAGTLIRIAKNSRDIFFQPSRAPKVEVKPEVRTEARPEVQAKAPEEARAQARTERRSEIMQYFQNLDIAEGRGCEKLF